MYCCGKECRNRGTVMLCPAMNISHQKRLGNIRQECNTKKGAQVRYVYDFFCFFKTFDLSVGIVSADARSSPWCSPKTIPLFTPFPQRACPSLCSWLLSWFTQWHLSSPYSVEHASCPGRGYLGWYCSSSSVTAWHSA